MYRFLNELGQVVITMLFHVLIMGLLFKSDPNLALAYAAFIALKAYQSFMKIMRYKQALKNLGAVDLGNGAHVVKPKKKDDE